ncbi:MAG: hypothetical protein AVO33_02835 [delta proteobacterium ML8_F1]|nr:MAG: hypothetical protein AVO33_02835 [delta proteobacterium ML8_F1]
MKGTILGNRYEIIEKIGDGGMSDVYKARCQVLKRHVAVKILKSEFNADPEFVKKFDAESTAVAGLNHPNIVNIFDVGIEADLRYIVMEFVDGKTLKSLIREKQGPLEENEIIRLSMQIASALDHAHRHHIIHRDIKSQNIMISNQQVAKVADFGIAKAMSASTVVHSNEVMGSVQYASPEQSKGSVIDHRSDIYSLGVVMYEMATGRLPFVGENAVTIALKHMREQVVPPGTYNKTLSNGLEEVIARALMKNPDSRYQTVSELMVDLNRLRSNPSETFDYENSEDYDYATMVLPNYQEIDAMSKKAPTKKKSKNKPQKGNRLTMVTVILLALLASLLIFSIVGFNLLKDKFIPQEVEVPNLIELTFEEAKTALNERGLYIEEEGTRFSNVIEKGRILEQSEVAGTILKEGFTIKVVVSKGQNLVEIPNLLQKELSEAQIILDNLELSVDSVEYVVNDLPKGYILAQEPASGELIEKGQAIKLIVSQGSTAQEYIMPTITGLTYEEALGRLEGNNIQLALKGYDYSDFPQDTIASQSISQGTIVYPGDVVDVTISNGPKLTTRSYKLYTQYFEGDEETVTIEMIDEQGDARIVYSQLHAREEESFVVELTAKGEVTINIYYGETLFNTLNEHFE